MSQENLDEKKLKKIVKETLGEQKKELWKDIKNQNWR